MHISYYDYNNNDLKYVTNKSGPWVVDTVDSTSYSWDSLLYTSLALDEGIVHISYTEGVYDYSNHVWHYYIKYATNKNGAWVRTLVDSAGDGAGYSSLALDAEGMAHISYCDSTNHDLKYARQFLLDSDCDAILDYEDNCPDVSNPNQEDIDGDFIGNVCDNCPSTPDPPGPPGGRIRGGTPESCASSLPSQVP